MEIKKTIDLLEKGVSNVFTSDGYREYLRVMSRFHNYSLNNSILIFFQKPDATLVSGYQNWKKNKRYVKRGEKAITILAPLLKKEKEITEDDSKEEETIILKGFRPVSVFDISQTEGQELPQICNELSGSVENYSSLIKDLSEKATSAEVSFAPLNDNSGKGYFNRTTNTIVINTDMSEAQTLKTLIHEIAHSNLHQNAELNLSRQTKEVEAESVAFVVSHYLGLDTSSYSFEYIASWSSNYILKELKTSLERIKKQSEYIINCITEGKK